MRKKGLIFTILLFMILMLNVPVGAQISDGELKADQIKLEDELVVAQENVSFLYNDGHFTGNNFTYHLEQGDIEMKGNLRLEFLDYILTGNLLEGNLEREEIDVYGDIEIEGEELWATGEELFYRGPKEELVLQKQMEVEYIDFWARAESLTYSLDRQTAFLEGAVEGTRQGQKFSANNVEIDINNDVVNLKGSASLIFGESEETE